MNTAQPIRNENELKKFKDYYKNVKPNIRNHMLIIVGLNTALRISDILNLKWYDIYDFQRKKVRQYLELREQKTGKLAYIYINNNIADVARNFLEVEGDKISPNGDTYIFRGNNKKNHLSRIQAWRIVKKAGEEVGIEGVISPHSLRKTFGYLAYKRGALPSLLVNVFNHSSFNITKRYLGIDQDEKDSLYKLMEENI